MFSTEFLKAFADFYGSFSLDEIAERLGLDTVDVVEYFDDEIDNNLDFFQEEMGYIDEEDEDEGED